MIEYVLYIDIQNLLHLHLNTAITCFHSIFDWWHCKFTFWSSRVAVNCRFLEAPETVFTESNQATARKHRANTNKIIVSICDPNRLVAASVVCNSFLALSFCKRVPVHFHSTETYIHYIHGLSFDTQNHSENNKNPRAQNCFS